MFVCICNGISDKDLRTSFDEGAQSVPALQMKTGCGTCCGCCLDMVDDLVKEWGPSVPYNPSNPLAGGSNIMAMASEPLQSSRISAMDMAMDALTAEPNPRGGWRP